MAWNEQSSPTSGGPMGSGTPSTLPQSPAEFGMPPNMQSPLNAGIDPNGVPNNANLMPGMTGVPGPEAMNPPAANPAEQRLSPEAYAGPAPGPTPPNPLMQQAMPPSVSPQAVAVGAGMPAHPLPAAGQGRPAVSDDETDVDDVVWVNRTKKVIATTQGDPYRRVQLLQQLSVLYLKEKYGRSVHADES